VLGTLRLQFQSQCRLQVESIVLRHQLIVLCRAVPIFNGIQVDFGPARTCQWERTRRSRGRSSGLVGSLRSTWSAACITDTLESSFR
jgi:hypothetical protein